MLKILACLSLLSLTSGSHFRGGSISWKPISDNGATVTVEFQAYWAWRRSFSSQTCNYNDKFYLEKGNFFLIQKIVCDSSTISSGSLMGVVENIVCRVGCASTGEVIGTTAMKCNNCII